MGKKTKAEQGAEDILAHGFKLQRIFPKAKASGYGPVSLYKRLHRLEAEAHRLAERECNEDLDALYGKGYSERKMSSIMKRLDAILGFKDAGIKVFVNGDPRGHALKIDDKDVKEKNLDIFRDWGGYGILCPDF